MQATTPNHGLGIFWRILNSFKTGRICPCTDPQEDGVVECEIVEFVDSSQRSMICCVCKKDPAQGDACAPAHRSLGPHKSPSILHSESIKSHHQDPFAIPQPDSLLPTILLSFHAKSPQRSFPSSLPWPFCFSRSSRQPPARSTSSKPPTVPATARPRYSPAVTRPAWGSAPRS